jgi:hypothetical protein
MDGREDQPGEEQTSSTEPRQVDSADLTAADPEPPRKEPVDAGTEAGHSAADRPLMTAPMMTAS